MPFLRRLIEKWREHSTHLTIRGRVFVVLSAALLIAAYSAGNREFLLVGCLLLALNLVAVIHVWTRAMSLSVTRKFAPAPVSAGKTTAVLVHVTNRGRIRTAPAKARDALPWSPWHSVPSGLSMLRQRNAHFGPSRQPTVLRYLLTPPRRGVYPIGPLTVDFSDPFGLVTSHLAVGEIEELIVTPQVVPLPESGLWLEAPDGAARLVHPTAIGNDDDLMTREYRRGDALRRVHWRASARHGQLMVRQEEQRAFPEARIVLDTTRSGYSRPDNNQWSGRVNWLYPESAEFEWGVDMVAALGTHLHDSGFLVHVLETGHHQIADPGMGSSRADREHEFLESLAAVRLTDEHVRAGRGKVKRGARRGEEARGPVFAIISRPDDETIQWLRTMRRATELGFAFIVGGSSTVESTLTKAGWHVLEVSVGTNPAWAWATIAEQPGLVRVAN